VWVTCEVAQTLLGSATAQSSRISGALLTFHSPGSFRFGAATQDATSTGRAELWQHKKRTGVAPAGWLSQPHANGSRSGQEEHLAFNLFLGFGWQGTVQAPRAWNCAIGCPTSGYLRYVLVVLHLTCMYIQYAQYC
jgi:hypothetical protein